MICGVTAADSLAPDGQMYLADDLDELCLQLPATSLCSIYCSGKLESRWTEYYNCFKQESADCNTLAIKAQNASIDLADCVLGQKKDKRWLH